MYNGKDVNKLIQSQNKKKLNAEAESDDEDNQPSTGNKDQEDPNAEAEGQFDENLKANRDEMALFQHESRKLTDKQKKKNKKKYFPSLQVLSYNLESANSHP